MKINKKKSAKKILLITLGLLGLAFLSLFVLEKLRITNFINPPKASDSNLEQTIDNNPPTPEQKAAGDLQKKTTIETVPDSGLTVSITAINSNNDPIQIRSVVNGASSSSGNCTLNLTNGATTVTKTSATFALPNSSTCQGFDINKNELSSGKWQLELIVNIDNKQSSVTDSFTLE